jgi:signal peptidase I
MESSITNKRGGMLTNLRVLSFFFALFTITISTMFTFPCTITIGESMAPILDDGDISICKREFLYLRNFTGDICVVKMITPWTGTYFGYNMTKGEPILITHRVIMDNGTHILTKGDNNTLCDLWVPRTNIVARLIWTDING